MKGKHSKLIYGQIDGKPFTAFIDGIPDKCDHDDDGDILSFNDMGEYFKESEMPDKEMDYESWCKFQDDHKINGGCVSCSKCGKPFEPNLFEMT